MSDPIWGQLAKGVADPEKIEEAIARIVAEHEADPIAHLSTNGSLQSHKASEIIDHLAESILNDKLEILARSFTAIVTPTGGDFNDIQSAISFCHDQGGGNIFVAPGTYTLTADLYLNSNIKIVGAGVYLSVIDCNGFCIVPANQRVESSPYFEEEIDFVVMDSLKIQNGGADMVQSYMGIDFFHCWFYNGAGNLVSDQYSGNLYSHCTFQFTSSFFATNYSNDIRGLNGEEATDLIVEHCTFLYCPVALFARDYSKISFNKISSARIGIYSLGDSSVIDGNILYDCRGFGIYSETRKTAITNNNISGKAVSPYYSSDDGIYVKYGSVSGSENNVVGNFVDQFVNGVNLPTSSSYNIVIGNNCRGNSSNGVLNNGTFNVVANNITS